MCQCATAQVTHAFPAVLEKLDLPAFDMSKIISMFVRHLAPADQVCPPSMTPALVNLARHLSVTSSAQRASACLQKAQAQAQELRDADTEQHHSGHAVPVNARFIGDQGNAYSCVQVPRELKRHLFSIEEKILEAQAWEKGSSLYPLLTAACSSARSSADNSPSNRDTAMSDSPKNESPKV